MCVIRFPSQSFLRTNNLGWAGIIHFPWQSLLCPNICLTTSRRQFFCTRIAKNLNILRVQPSWENTRNSKQTMVRHTIRPIQYKPPQLDRPQWLPLATEWESSLTVSSRLFHCVRYSHTRDESTVWSFIHSFIHLFIHIRLIEKVVRTQLYRFRLARPNKLVEDSEWIAYAWCCTWEVRSTVDSQKFELYLTDRQHYVYLPWYTPFSQLCVTYVFTSTCGEN